MKVVTAPGSSNLPPSNGRETIEVELNQPLLAAASSSVDEPPSDSSAKEAAPMTAQRSKSRPIVWGIAVALASMAVLVAYFRFTPSSVPPATAATAAAPTGEAAESMPVQFANAFDADEVFEFPAGTTDEVAREAVAQILMQRARDRQLSAATAQVTKPTARKALVAQRIETH